MTERPLRIAVIAPLRHPIRQPFAGGLESTLWNQIRMLAARGHRVTVCAVQGSDFLDLGPSQFVLPPVRWQDPADATDITYPAGHLEVAFAALTGALQWIADHREDFDLVDNHCLHGLPLEWTDRLGLPMMTNLHTPVLPEMLAAHRSTAGQRSHFLAVGTHTARTWATVGVDARVVPNAVDADLWPLGPGGEDLLWFGRIVPEKAPHLAIEVARATGRRIVLAGRIADEDYARAQLWPALGPDVEYAGELQGRDLAELVGSSGCVLVTPAWEEPFGMVIAEALMCGTPVAAFAIGGVPDVVAGHWGARLAEPFDVAGLAAAAQGLIDHVGGLADTRARIRAQAINAFSLDARITVLTEVFRDLVREPEQTGAAG